MSTSILIFIVIAIGIIGYLLGSSRAQSLAQGRASALHSRYGYHGSFVSILAVVPAFLVLGLWMAIAPSLIETRVRDAMPMRSRHSQEPPRTSITAPSVQSLVA